MAVKGTEPVPCLYVSVCAMVEHSFLLLLLMIVGVIMLSFRIREGDSLCCDSSHLGPSQIVLDKP